MLYRLFKQSLILFLFPSFFLFGTEARAIAVIYPKNDSKVKGVVTFTKVLKGVQVIAEIEGLPPGKHGFHIHEYGDCSAKDASSAGGHFNPTNQMHGCLTSKEHHIGDMGNITATKKGTAKYRAIIKDLSLEGPNSIIGKAVIIHEKKDDCHSQPTGDAGERLGCGVIGLAKGS